MNIPRQTFFTVILLALAGCSSMRISQFINSQPSMAPNIWMLGTVDGYGVVIDRFNNVKSQFHACERGSWNPSTRTVTLVENIVYLNENGDKQTDRTWYFVENNPGHWTGTAADVIGIAIGEQEGNAWHLVFRQRLSIGGHQLLVNVDDLRLREANDVAVDYSTITKFGIHLATAEIAFVKSRRSTCLPE